MEGETDSTAAGFYPTDEDIDTWMGRAFEMVNVLGHTQCQ